MSLSEQRVLKQIAIIPETQSVNVQWSNQILRDNLVISETPHRKAYTMDQKEEFLREVECADLYLTALGW